jgi:hypothetical protein
MDGEGVEFIAENFRYARRAPVVEIQTLRGGDARVVKIIVREQCAVIALDTLRLPDEQAQACHFLIGERGLHGLFVIIQ